MSKTFSFAPGAEVGIRAAQIDEILHCLCTPDEYPWFISDQASVFDVCSLAEGEIVDRISAHYGKTASHGDLLLPLWRLVDRLRQPAS